MRFVSTPKSSTGNRQRYLLLCYSLLMRRNSVLSGFPSIYRATSMTGQQPSIMVSYTVLASELLNSKDIYS